MSGRSKAGSWRNVVDEHPVKRTFPVRLLGRHLAIQTTAPREEVDTVASFVAKRLEEVRLASRSTDVAELAMLAAMNLASDLLRIQATLEDERSRLNRWATDLCARMDALSATPRHDANGGTEQATDSLE